MWKDLWRILKDGESLLDEARDECVQMLDLARQMFDLVVRTAEEKVTREDLVEIRKMDKVLNEKQRCIRIKVFEHLALSRGRDLLTGLVLTSVVIDLERIGDYTKNVGEIATWIPGKLDFGEYKGTYDSVVERTRDLLQGTREAFIQEDADRARKLVEVYQGISHDVDGMLKHIVVTGAPEDTVEKRILGLAMLLRYLKRMAAHLKNICTAISNPFPQIGFRPDGEGHPCG